MPSSRGTSGKNGLTRVAKQAVVGMDPRKLLYLATIVEQRSLAKAAKLLDVSQPALSKSMDRLEHSLGVKLLNRSAAGIEPTAMGEHIYSHARLIRDEMDLAEARLKQEHSGSQVVTLGTLPSLASSVIPLAVGQWKYRHPEVLLRVVEKVQVELLLGLLRGHFDFIVGQTEFYDVFLDGLKQRVLFRDRLSVFARKGHALFELDDLSWNDLVQFPWVCPMVGGPHRTVLEKLLSTVGVPLPDQLTECGSIDFTRALVASSDHLALLPEHSVTADVGSGTLTALNISVPSLNRDIALIFREGSPLSLMARDLVADIEVVGTELSKARAS